MTKIQNNYLKTFISYLLITLGAAIAAFSLQTLLIPNTLLDGGITGISIIVSKLTGIPIGSLILIANVPFLYIGFRNLGLRFLIRATYSMIIFSICLLIFQNFPITTNEILLATTFGGVILGVGVGLVIRFGGCLDGTESIAIVVSKSSSFSVGQVVLMFNLLIYAVAGIFFGLDRAMYSLLTYFITFKVIDFVAEGLEQGKAAMIITENGEMISKAIYKSLGRTTTTIKGQGYLSGEKEVLYCVITRIEVPELRRIVEKKDNSAFVTITDVSEIIGNHIKSNKKRRKKKQKDINS